MASPRKQQILGRAIAKERRGKGLTQKEVAYRIQTVYSGERSYRRIESGERMPDRDALIAILGSGICIEEVDRINNILKLGGYDPLTTAEERQCGIRVVQTVVPPSTPEITVPQVQPPPGEQSDFGSAALVGLCCLAVAGIIAYVSRETTFVMLSATVYGALYVVSILLESTFDPAPAPRWAGVSAVFGFVVITAVVALAIDARLAQLGRVTAMPVALAIFLVAATVQWLMARSALSESAVVPLHFQAHTAQVAHLKNTVYFLVVVILFWLPPFHCVAVLHREGHAGHTAWVKAMLEHRLLLGPDLICFNTEWLWFAFLLLVLLALPMAVRLLENLKSDPKLNTYTVLLYLRGILYFLLILVCLIWYSAAIASISA